MTTTAVPPSVGMSQTREGWTREGVVFFAVEGAGLCEE